ncbi:BRCT domain-containing protein [uncultured Clostridium sp.]|uniref:BRCT domain-containing protein n=1 Tax=uncultured Clostridium sp. TaxID=59620 RepID=UPI0026EAE330|nr:BRCT domain-containing protein [uncultured Clostridium sp.]
MENIFFELEAKGTYPKTICMNNDPTKSNVIDWLRYNFKHTIPDITATLKKDGFIDLMNRVFDNLTNPESDSYIDYELDGLVISSPDVIYHKSDYSYIYDECAFKFAAEEKETTINNIKWELSRTQRYVPVLEIEPVELSGATVQNVTGNNAKYLIENGLGVGAIISVCRSGEVIPKHMNTLEAADVNLPEKCPVCGHTLVWDGVDLKCAYEDCKNIEYSDLQQWCETIGETDGMAWTLMKQYLDKFGIKSIADLYNPIKKETIDNWAYMGNLSITDTKAVEFFGKLYINEIDVEKALLALNIPRLGDKTAKDLAKETDLVKQLIKDKETSSYLSETSHDGLLKVVKEATTQSIMENHYKKLKNILYIKDRIKYKETDNKEIIKVAVTGALNTMKRSAFEKYIESYGYELSSAIKSCRYLITNTPDSGSSKNKDAQKYGVEIITEQAFLDLLGGAPKTNSLF